MLGNTVNRELYKSIDGQLYSFNTVSGEVRNLKTDADINYCQITKPKSVLNYFFLMIKPTRTVSQYFGWTAQYLASLFSVTGFIVSVIVLLFGISFIDSMPWVSVHDLKEQMSGDAIALSIIILSFSKLLHELGHAAALRFCGYKENYLGLKLIGGVLPLPVCRVDQLYLVENKWKRLLVPLMGVYFEAVLLGLLLIVNQTSQSPVWFYAISFHSYLFIGSVIINFTPFTKFDGYMAWSMWSKNYFFYERSLVVYKNGFALAFMADSVGTYLFGFFATIWRVVMTVGIASAVLDINIVIGAIMLAISIVALHQNFRVMLLMLIAFGATQL